MPRITEAKKIFRQSFSNGSSTKNIYGYPKACLAVCVGEQDKKRFGVPVWLLSRPTSQELLDQAEDEFGYIHAMGGLTIPCSEYTFADLASRAL